MLRARLLGAWLLRARLLRAWLLRAWLLGTLLVLRRGPGATGALLARRWLLVRSRSRLLERLSTGRCVRVLAAEHRARPAGAARASGVRALLDRALAGRARLRGTVLLRRALLRGGRVPVPRALRLTEWLAGRLTGLLTLPGRPLLLSVPGRSLVRPVLLRPAVLLLAWVLLLAGVRRALLLGRLWWARWPLRSVALGIVAGLGVRLLGFVHRAPPPVGADA
ncbi:hypothetical protein GCM10022247_40090 [Allokutzneria multivorans]|uniref:Uncharacterized protein n=1 Tax=Allokutzneria multivorans TaxID=1142134 RepID=A0ABP7SL77_9PSEU